MMATLSELALAIEERDEGCFYWVVLEACEVEGVDVPVFRRIDSAARAQPSHERAVACGAAVVRRLAEE